MLELAAPWWLLAVPLPWLAWRGSILFQSGKLTIATAPATPLAIRHAQADVLFNLVGNTRPSINRTPWLWIIGCACLALALARPQWTESAPNIYKGRDFLLALDVSGSMRAQDFIVEGTTLSRLDMLKKVVNQFISERHGDRVGIIVFADDAYTLSPVTRDMTVVRSLLKEVRHGMAGEKTALGTAMALAIKRLRDNDAKARVLIILTDGSNTAGDIHPDAATALAVEEGIRIYTVGIGSHQTVPFPRGPNEAPAYTEMPLDEDLLRRIAQRTHGQYYAAANTEQVQRIINDIEQLEKIDITDSTLLKHTELYWLPLITGLALLLMARHRTRNEVLP
jgi:Ca-activated chloride channel homolog